MRVIYVIFSGADLSSVLAGCLGEDDEMISISSSDSSIAAFWALVLLSTGIVRRVDRRVGTVGRVASAPAATPPAPLLSAPADEDAPPASELAPVWSGTPCETPQDTNASFRNRAN